ncbi:MAG TPA: single-stranded DNA-binding protein [Rickettsiales bacterium]|nr:single-stranded DNA-binding protein [Rickettsiales bacterium]
MAINKVILVGNVGKDPEIRSMSNGNEVATFSLATTDIWKDKTTHERKEKTEWHRIVVYSQGLVNIVKSYVKKGTKLYIEGSLQTRKWVGNDGLEKYTTEIVLQGFNSVLQLLDTRNPSSSSASGTTNNETSESFPDEKEIAEAGEFIDEKVDDTIPF